MQMRSPPSEVMRGRIRTGGRIRTTGFDRLAAWFIEVEKQFFCVWKSGLGEGNENGDSVGTLSNIHTLKW